MKLIKNSPKSPKMAEIAIFRGGSMGQSVTPLFGAFFCRNLAKYWRRRGIVCFFEYGQGLNPLSHWASYSTKNPDQSVHNRHFFSILIFQNSFSPTSLSSSFFCAFHVHYPTYFVSTKSILSYRLFYAWFHIVQNGCRDQKALLQWSREFRGVR